jgi:hypothetical protein
MSNWDIPREKAMDIAVTLARRGYDIDYAVECVTQMHYSGKSRSIARGMLQRDAIVVFYERHGGLTEKQETAYNQLSTMAETLRAEGWKLITHNNDFLWRHTEAHVDVNRNGGLWSTYAEATRRTFNSQTRQLVRRQSNGNNE